MTANNSHAQVTRADAHAPGEVADWIDFVEQGASPATPASGSVRVFAKAGSLWGRDDAGTDTDLGAGGGGGSTETWDDAVVALSSGLVHRWKYDEASGNFADDVSTLDLTASGTITYQQAGPAGATSAARFASGARGAAGGMGSAPVGNAARTSAILFKTDGDLTTSAAILSWGTTGTARLHWGLLLNAASVGYQDAAQVWTDDLIVAQVGSSDGEWHLLINAWDGNRGLYFYQDGKMLGVKRLTSALNTGTGTTPRTPQDNIAIYIDDALIWNRRLRRWEMDRLWTAAKAAIEALG